MTGYAKYPGAIARWGKPSSWINNVVIYSQPSWLRDMDLIILRFVNMLGI